MPSILALILYTTFVLFLLRLDRKQYPDASLSLWLPTFLLLIITGKALGTWFGISGATMEEGSAIDRNVLILLLCLGLLILKKRNVNITGVFRQNISVVLLIGFMLISVTWSDMPFISFKRWIRNIIPIVMALIIASEDDPRQALQSVFRRLVYIYIPFSHMLIKYYPHLGRKYGLWSGELMWVGVSDQKNGLAFICMFTIFFLVWTLIRRWKSRDNPVWYQTYIDIFIIFLSIWLFMGPNQKLTYSATSMVALAIALISLFGFLWLKKHNIIIGVKTLTILIVAIIIFGTATVFVGHLPIFQPPEVLNRDATLTGRSEIWAFLVPYAKEKPILGHGFGGFWTSELRSTGNFPAHNGYLETILVTGFIGLLFLSIFLIENCRRAQRLMTIDFDWGIFWFCILLIGVTRNITESVIMNLSGYMPAILLFILIPSINFSEQAK